MKSIVGATALCALCVCIWLMLPVSAAFGHCDTMNGPVVKAAQKALETNNVNLVLVWVQKKDEGAIRDAFTKTLAVRKLGAEAKNLADMYFFETLVRIHRAGEGVSYTGLKPAEAKVDPGIEAADEALELGSVDKIAAELGAILHKEIRERFDAAYARRNFKDSDLAAGRKYVESYVTFIHYVEGLHLAIQGAAGAHGGEPAEEPAHGHR